MNLYLKSLDAAKQELRRLSEQDLISSTDWSTYQVFAHCAQTIDYSIFGYPLLKPAFIRNTVGRLAIHKFLKQGYMKHDLSAGVPGSPKIEKSGGSSRDGIETLLQSIEHFEAYQGELKPHLLFGKLTKAQYDCYFAMHIADHLTGLSIE